MQSKKKPKEKNNFEVQMGFNFRERTNFNFPPLLLIR